MPLNTEKQIVYWKNGAIDDIESAEVLLQKNKIKQSLFFAHLSLEKMLKALVVKATGDIAPYSHDLPYLQQKSGIEFPDNINKFLAKINKFSIEGRYPDMQTPVPSVDAAEKHLKESREVMEWLMSRL